MPDSPPDAPGAAGLHDSAFDDSVFNATERRRLRTVIAATLIAVSLPYVWAVLSAPLNSEYSGLLYSVVDQNVHLAWMRQARDGHFFFRDLFTTEGLASGERPLFNNLFCWLVGVLSALTHLPLVVVYHAARLLFAALALRWFYGLCALLTSDRRVRLAALCLAAFSSGAGWMAPAFPGRTFIDRADHALMMPEAFTFTSTLVYPLFAASTALLPLIYGLVLRAQATGRARYTVAAGGAALLLGNIHTYDVLPLGATLLLWATWSALRKDALRDGTARDDAARPPNADEQAPDRGAAPGAASETASEIARVRWAAPLAVVLCAALPALYQAVVFRNSREFRIKALTPTPPPPLPDLALSYGPLLLLAIVGAVALRRDRHATLMTLWAVVTLASIYAPVSFARKMIEGVHLPLCFLAAAGLIWFLTRLAERAPQRLSSARQSMMPRFIASAFVALMSVSSMEFVLWCLDHVRDNNRARVQYLDIVPPLYLSPGDAAALRFLDGSMQPRDRAVLCLPMLGNYVPRATGHAVYVGHWAETLDFRAKLGEVSDFYTGQMTAAQAAAWLHRNHIGYVVIGFYEKRLGATLPLPLPLIHSQADAAIYAVPPP